LFAVLVVVIAALALLPVADAAAQTTTAAPTALRDGDVGCGTDLGCFADLAPDCTASAVSYTATLDLAPLVGLQRGLESRTTDDMRLQPDPNGTAACQFSILVQRVDNRLLPEAVQTLKDRGVAQASIDETQSSIATSGKSLEGRSGTCLFAPADLSAMLQKWQQGNISTEDFAAGSCQGTYFNN
jgi:hypothetical protein